MALTDLFKSATDIHLKNLDEEKLYAIAADEISRGALSAGLYAKALAESNGVENLAKAKYIKLRVDMLRAERAAIIEQASLADQERIKREVVDKEKQKKHAAEVSRIESAKLESDKMERIFLPHYKQNNYPKSTPPDFPGFWTVLVWVFWLIVIAAFMFGTGIFKIIINMLTS